jgi:peptide/nickel transport system substrate-binding protein
MRRQHSWLLALFFAEIIFCWTPAAARLAPARILVVCDDVNEPPTLDPQKEFVEKNHTIVQQIYDGLVRFTPQGHIQPALALSWKRIDPLVTEFSLRRDVYFHDGAVFNADAVKFSIDRYLDPDTGFPALGFLHPLEGVDIVDEYTVRLRTRIPTGLLLNQLAGFIVIVSPDYVRAHGDEAMRKKPIGTGAFRFKKWDKGHSIELEANPNYWEAGLPRVGGVIFKFIPRKNQLDALFKGDVDIVTDIPGTETLKVQQSKTTKVVKFPTLSTVAATFNTSTGPGADALIRKALNYAVDKNELIRFDVMGNGVPIRRLAFAESGNAIKPSSLNNYSYDLPKATRYLERSSAGSNLRLRVIEIKATRAAKVIAGHWRRLGINVDVVSTTDAEVAEKLRKEPWDIFIGYCPNPMHHPSFIYSIFLHSKSPFSLTNDPRMDELIESSQSCSDGVCLEHIERLSAYVNRHALTVYTYQRIMTYGVRNGVECEPYVSGMPFFRNCYMEEEIQ